MYDTLILLYDNQSDASALSIGSWAPTLPITNMLTRNLREVARTTDTALASTKFRSALSEPVQTLAFIVGPTNLSVSFAYKLTWYSDAFVTETGNTGWLNPFSASIVDFFSIPWEAPYFWSGIPPYDDVDRGIWLIHVFNEPLTTQYWQLEIDDQLNSDGYVQAGRFLIMKYWVPSINYDTSNGLSFRNGTMTSTTLRGGKHHWRRINARVWSCKFPSMPEGELFQNAYRVIQRAGYDQEVFVIPNSADSTNIQSRSFLANIIEADPISQAGASLASAGFTVEEVVQ